MPNMSYCKFENTLSDLRDCLYDFEDRLENAIPDSDHLPVFELPDSDGCKLSETERRAAIELLELCERISDEFGIN